MPPSKKDNQEPDWISRIQIRPIQEADLPGLEWDGEYRHFRRLYAEIFDSSQRGRSLMWVVDLEGTGIIGQLFVQLNSARTELANGMTRAYIYGFRIRPLYRGNGLGTSMMKIVEADLKRRGYKKITLNVGRDNPEARRLYERLGYRVVANEPGYWSYRDDNGELHDVHEPAWRMEKELNQVERN